MKDFGKKIIRLIDGLIDKSILLVCIVLFLLGSYGLYDSYMKLYVRRQKLLVHLCMQLIHFMKNIKPELMKPMQERHLLKQSKS